MLAMWIIYMNSESCGSYSNQLTHLFKEKGTLLHSPHFVSFVILVIWVEFLRVFFFNEKIVILYSARWLPNILISIHSLLNSTLLDIHPCWVAVKTFLWCQFCYESLVRENHGGLKEFQRGFWPSSCGFPINILHIQNHSQEKNLLSCSVGILASNTYLIHTWF